jgi:hypothetical protein
VFKVLLVYPAQPARLVYRVPQAFLARQGPQAHLVYAARPVLLVQLVFLELQAQPARPELWALPGHRAHKANVVLPAQLVYRGLQVSRARLVQAGPVAKLALPV